jgi:hypothetical protein
MFFVLPTASKSEDLVSIGEEFCACKPYIFEDLI